MLQKCDKLNVVGMSKQVTTLPNSNRMSLTHHRRLYNIVLLKSEGGLCRTNP